MSSQHIEAGATIKRTEVSIEVEKVLSDLYLLLRTVEPAELNQMLNALATALEGRGDELGQNSRRPTATSCGSTRRSRRWSRTSA